ncbi:zinc finger protein, putative [Hepatocystis sp. ex Piliocolobus tephrosceles]|nr:zinc finger protein, putative [Hepatocystis sp. ex Piliocolobus tephrosceles]
MIESNRDSIMNIQEKGSKRNCNVYNLKNESSNNIVNFYDISLPCVGNDNCSFMFGIKKEMFINDINEYMTQDIEINNSNLQQEYEIVALHGSKKKKNGNKINISETNESINNNAYNNNNNNNHYITENQNSIIDENMCSSIRDNVVLNPLPDVTLSENNKSIEQNKNINENNKFFNQEIELDEVNSNTNNINKINDIQQDIMRFPGEEYVIERSIKEAEEVMLPNMTVHNLYSVNDNSTTNVLDNTINAQSQVSITNNNTFIINENASLSTNILVNSHHLNNNNLMNEHIHTSDPVATPIHTNHSDNEINIDNHRRNQGINNNFLPNILNQNGLMNYTGINNNYSHEEGSNENDLNYYALSISNELNATRQNINSNRSDDGVEEEEGEIEEDDEREDTGEQELTKKYFLSKLLGYEITLNLEEYNLNSAIKTILFVFLLLTLFSIEFVLLYNNLFKININDNNIVLIESLYNNSFTNNFLLQFNKNDSNNVLLTNDIIKEEIQNNNIKLHDDMCNVLHKFHIVCNLIENVSKTDQNSNNLNNSLFDSSMYGLNIFKTDNVLADNFKSNNTIDLIHQSVDKSNEIDCKSNENGDKSNENGDKSNENSSSSSSSSKNSKNGDSKVKRSCDKPKQNSDKTKQNGYRINKGIDKTKQNEEKIKHPSDKTKQNGDKINKTGDRTKRSIDKTKPISDKTINGDNNKYNGRNDLSGNNNYNKNENINLYDNNSNGVNDGKKLTVQNKKTMENDLNTKLNIAEKTIRIYDELKSMGMLVYKVNESILSPCKNIMIKSNDNNDHSKSIFLFVSARKHLQISKLFLFFIIFFFGIHIALVLSRILYDFILFLSFKNYQLSVSSKRKYVAKYLWSVSTILFLGILLGDECMVWLLHDLDPIFNYYFQFFIWYISIFCFLTYLFSELLRIYGEKNENNTSIYLSYYLLYIHEFLFVTNILLACVFMLININKATVITMIITLIVLFIDMLNDSYLEQIQVNNLQEMNQNKHKKKKIQIIENKKKDGKKLFLVRLNEHIYREATKDDLTKMNESKPSCNKQEMVKCNENTTGGENGDINRSRICENNNRDNENDNKTQGEWYDEKNNKKFNLKNVINLNNMFKSFRNKKNNQNNSSGYSNKNNSVNSYVISASEYCEICDERLKNVVLYPCMHGGFCETCVRLMICSSLKINDSHPSCPLCRDPIQNVYKITYEKKKKIVEAVTLLNIKSKN